MQTCHNERKVDVERAVITSSKACVRDINERCILGGRVGLVVRRGRSFFNKGKNAFHGACVRQENKQKDHC